MCKLWSLILFVLVKLTQKQHVLSHLANNAGNVGLSRKGGHDCTHSISSLPCDFKVRKINLVGVFTLFL